MLPAASLRWPSHTAASSALRPGHGAPQGKAALVQACRGWVAALQPPRAAAESSALWSVTGTAQLPLTPAAAPADGSAPGAAQVRGGRLGGAPWAGGDGVGEHPPARSGASGRGRKRRRKGAAGRGGTRSGGSGDRGGECAGARPTLPTPLAGRGEEEEERRRAGLWAPLGLAARRQERTPGTAPPAIAPQPRATAALYGMWLVTFLLLYSLRKGTSAPGRAAGAPGFGRVASGSRRERGRAAGAEPVPGLSVLPHGANRPRRCGALSARSAELAGALGAAPAGEPAPGLPSSRCAAPAVRGANGSSRCSGSGGAGGGSRCSPAGRTVPGALGALAAERDSVRGSGSGAGPVAPQPGASGVLVVARGETPHRRVQHPLAGPALRTAARRGTWRAALCLPTSRDRLEP